MPVSFTSDDLEALARAMCVLASPHHHPTATDWSRAADEAVRALLGARGLRHLGRPTGAAPDASREAAIAYLLSAAYGVGLNARATDGFPTPEAVRQRFGLTWRQAETALLLAQRKTNREVAEALGISLHTARHHTEAVLAALGVADRRAVAAVLLSPDGAA